MTNFSALKNVQATTPMQ